MARPYELVPGNCYFLLNYYDEDLKVPFIRTYLFEQEAEGENDEKLWLFREPTSDEQQPDGPVITAVRENELYQVLDLDGLIKSLGELVHLHPFKPLPQTAPGSPRLRDEIPELRGVAEKVLEMDGRRSVTMTIRYTDDGFSIGRNEAGLYAGFFVKVHLEAQLEREIRSIFAALGLEPSQDYLSQQGRVRVLAYPIPAEEESLELLAKKLLVDVYRMRQSDGLDLNWSEFE
ncbi:MAG TPA: hypothetical protein VFU13_16895 [Steroidobacteraceae bacterium]|nr:hypothetical protein [Steroidobacteraceae bacterium]